MTRLMRAPVPATGPVPARPDPGPAVVSLAGPKRRRPSWALFGGLAVGLAGLLGAWAFVATSDRVSIVVAARDLDPGEVVGAADLRVIEIGGSKELRAVGADQRSLLVGRAARGPIPAGSVLNTDLFADRLTVIPAGMVVVGAALEPGAAPTADLASGDPVQVLGVVKAAGPQAGVVSASLLAEVSVWSVGSTASGGAAGKVWVSLLVPSDAQDEVAQAAADGRLRLSLLGSVR